MEDLNQYYTALKNAHAAGDVEGAKKLASHIKTMQSSPASVEPETTVMQDIKQGAGNLLAGGVRGAGRRRNSIDLGTKGGGL